MQGFGADFLKPRLVDVQRLSSTHFKVVLEPLERWSRRRLMAFCTNTAVSKVFRKMSLIFS